MNEKDIDRIADKIIERMKNEGNLKFYVSGKIV